MRSDRHGRAFGVDNDPRRRPTGGFRVRDAKRFRRVVDDAVAALPGRLARPLAGARLVIEDLPPEEPGNDVPLATFAPGVLTIYRRPLEARASSRISLEEAVLIAVGQAVGRAQGYGDDIEDLFG